MIHAGGFTTLMLAVLDGMIRLDSDCLNVNISNVTAELPDDERCTETFNYTTQYCPCYYTTMNKTHRIIEAARYSSISFANTENLQDIEQVIMEVKKVLSAPAEIFSNINNCTSTPHPCLPLYEEKKNRTKNYTAAYHKLQTYLETARTTQNTVLYYMPPFVAVVLICGMIGNCTLLFIFYKHPETRSGPKLLLVNLAVSDVLILLLNLFTKYIFRLFPFTLGPAACCIYTFLASTPVRASILSIMVLSITRYIAVSAVPGDRCHNLLDYMPVAIALVWTAASLEAIQPSIDSAITVFHFSDKTHCDFRPSTTTAIMMNIACFLPLVVIAFFTFATYRRLRDGEQNTLGKTKLDKVKERNAKILPALALLFTITYPPLYVFWLAARISDFALSNTTVFFYHLTRLLISVNPALNPIVLYFSSGMFRNYFKKYLCFRCKKRKSNNRDRSAVRAKVMSHPFNNTNLMYEEAIPVSNTGQIVNTLEVQTKVL